MHAPMQLSALCHKDHDTYITDGLSIYRIRNRNVYLNPVTLAIGPMYSYL